MSQGNLEKCEPNFTPLLDLVLQLVMFFMLCANFVLDQTNVKIKLPSAIAAKAIEKSEESVIFLNVNDKGVVVLAPVDQMKDAEGKVIETLDNPAQVESFLKRRAQFEAKRAGPANKDKEVRTLLILRVDKDCEFEKTYGIMKACRKAGYLRVQLRAIRHSGIE